MVHRATILSVEEYFGPKKSEDAKYGLSFARGTGQDFDVLLSFPGVRGPLYPLAPCPMIAEFRAMLAALTPKARPPQHWPVRFSAKAYALEKTTMPRESRQRRSRPVGTLKAGDARCSALRWQKTTLEHGERLESMRPFCFTSKNKVYGDRPGSQGKQHFLYLRPLPQGHGSLRPGATAAWGRS
jgi:hypothetical protein